jgi:maltooligosyltrehalose synthase
MLAIAAEKILSEGESLRRDWAVAGTTGYNFLNAVAGPFVEGRNTQRLRRVHSRLTGRQASFADVAYESKRTILLTATASELNVLAHALNRLSERDRRHRDFTLNNCRIKLFITACGVRFRREHPEVARDGSYDPLRPEGPSAEHLAGFGRRHKSGELLVIAPRLLVSLVPDDAPPIGEAIWTTTRIQLPDSHEARCYRHLLTGEAVRVEEGADGRWIRAADLYRHLPVGMLWAPSGVETTDRPGMREVS